MRQLVSAACGLWAAFAPMAQAENLVVVELFASQGCSSCPPADDFVAMLAADPKVLPLSLHVDYWDYIGWTDSFADPRFTERQKSYARAIGSRTIYTPQFTSAARTGSRATRRKKPRFGLPSIWPRDRR